jgi:hypothetical protein
MRVDPREFIEADDKVVVIGRAFATARRSGMPLDTQIAFVWTLRDGKLVRNEVFTDRREALEAAGLRSRPRTSALPEKQKCRFHAKQKRGCPADWHSDAVRRYLAASSLRTSADASNAARQDPKA